MVKPIFKIIIAGGREFKDYAFMKAKLDHLLSAFSRRYTIVIVSGRARGADKLGEDYAEERGYDVEYHPVSKQEWDDYGWKAGHMRNERMAKVAQGSICFWDGRSGGTKNMIDLSKKYKLKHTTVIYK